MGLASVVHNGVQIPFNIDHGVVRVSHSPPPSKCSVPHPISTFCSVYHCRRAPCVPVLCFKRIGHNHGFPSSEVKRISAQPKDDISNVETSRTQGNETYSSSVRNVALWVCTAVAFGVGLGFKEGVGKASEFFAGYLLEQSLSVDNLFVFVLVFKYFKVPIMYQNRVLSYGIAGAVVFRLTLILLGAATLQRFEAVNLLLASLLLYSSFKLFTSEEDESDLSNNFVVKTCQKFIPVTTYYDENRFITNQDGVWKATPLLLTVAVIELSDIAFAVDSIPAVFGVTRDPFVAFTSNLFAILSLRSLYPIISEGMSELEYLQDLVTGRTIRVAKEHEALYYLLNMPTNGDLDQKLLLSCHKSSFESFASQIWLQHKRLGHLSFSLLKTMFPSLFLKESIESFHCDVCEFAKNHRIIFSPIYNRSVEPFALIHSYVWDPTSISKISGTKWFVFFH